MSNDPTAVVFTPAVLAVCKKAKARPMPYLLACALTANAASFMLPVSNPANLVVFADKLTTLRTWLAQFAVPSLFAIGTTYAVLNRLSRRGLKHAVSADVHVPALSLAGRIAAGSVVLMTLVLLTCSALDIRLGLPALTAAAGAWLSIAVVKRESPRPVVAHFSWTILPLVARLFVIVEGLRQAGLLRILTQLLHYQASASTGSTAALGAGILVALACNLMNNLPAGLIAGSEVSTAHVSPLVQSAVLIGVDLGPNLSVTGSLATILWLVAIKRQGDQVSAWTFLKVGALAMPVALFASLAAMWLQSALLG